jgi:hypothetical protein
MFNRVRAGFRALLDEIKKMSHSRKHSRKNNDKAKKMEAVTTLMQTIRNGIDQCSSAEEIHRFINSKTDDEETFLTRLMTIVNDNSDIDSLTYEKNISQHHIRSKLYQHEISKKVFWYSYTICNLLVTYGFQSYDNIFKSDRYNSSILHYMFRFEPHASQIVAAVLDAGSRFEEDNNLDEIRLKFFNDVLDRALQTIDARLLTAHRVCSFIRMLFCVRDVNNARGVRAALLNNSVIDSLIDEKNLDPTELLQWIYLSFGDTFITSSKLFKKLERKDSLNLGFLFVKGLRCDPFDVKQWKSMFLDDPTLDFEKYYKHHREVFDVVHIFVQSLFEGIHPIDNNIAKHLPHVITQKMIRNLPLETVSDVVFMIHDILLKWHQQNQYISEDEILMNSPLQRFLWMFHLFNIIRVDDKDREFRNVEESFDVQPVVIDERVAAQMLDTLNRAYQIGGENIVTPDLQRNIVWYMISKNIIHPEILHWFMTHHDDFIQCLDDGKVAISWDMFELLLTMDVFKKWDDIPKDWLYSFEVCSVLYEMQNRDATGKGIAVIRDYFLDHRQRLSRLSAIDRIHSKYAEDKVLKRIFKKLSQHPHHRFMYTNLDYHQVTNWIAILTNKVHKRSRDVVLGNGKILGFTQKHFDNDSDDDDENENEHVENSDHHNDILSDDDIFRILHEAEDAHYVLFYFKPRRSHANVMVVDNFEKRVFRFEPHGHRNKMSSVMQLGEVRVATLAGDDYRAIPLPEVSLQNGPQHKDHLHETDMSYDPRERGGYCQIWSFMFMDYVMTYPDVDILEIQNMLTKVGPKGVRDYALYMWIMISEVMNSET